MPLQLQEYARKKNAGKKGFEESMLAKLQKQEARRQKRQEKRATVTAAAAQAITQYGTWLCWHLACRRMLLTLLCHTDHHMHCLRGLYDKLCLWVLASRLCLLTGQTKQRAVSYTQCCGRQSGPVDAAVKHCTCRERCCSSACLINLVCHYCNLLVRYLRRHAQQCSGCGAVW